jgi:hypothetical protein
MGKLKADFESDWIAHLRGQLARVWGAAEVERLLDRDVPNYYFETFRRRLARRERVIKIADNFQCPWEAEAGWRVLQNKVRQGDDLNPHLSRRHASLANNDGLLAEWGVHHFHLGTTADPHDPRYARRTGPLVFALADDHSFCAINV